MNENTNLSEILTLLYELKNSLICKLCSKEMTDPVRIKSCGHYLCNLCLNFNKGSCPKCKHPFSCQDIDDHNLARISKPLLDELEHVLKSCIEDTVFESNFRLDDVSYKINFVNSTVKINAKGETPLHLACSRNKYSEVLKLIEAKNDINAKDFAGWSPLHEAVEAGSVEIVELLLERGALVDIMGPEYITPLHSAVIIGSLPIVEKLLQYGANKELLDYYGKKPFEFKQIKNIIKGLQDTKQMFNKTKNIFVNKKIVAYCHSINEEYKAQLKNCKAAIVAEEFKPEKRKITHFCIKKTHKVSMKILIAVLEGLIFVHEEWIKNFLRNDYKFPLFKHIFLTSNPALSKGIQKAMLNSLLKRPKLFDGMHFYIEKHKKSLNIYNMEITKNGLETLVSAGGGKLLQRAPTLSSIEGLKCFPYHIKPNSKLWGCSHYVIFDLGDPPELQYKMPELKHVSSKWFIDCIINFEIL